MIEYLPLVLTGIGIIVSILYYTSVLRNANKTREAQLFMQSYKETSTPELQQLAYELLSWQWRARVVLPGGVENVLGIYFSPSF